jgi:hypothetical protein
MMPRTAKPEQQPDRLIHFSQHGPAWLLGALFIDRLLERLPAILLAGSWMGTTAVALIYGPAITKFFH